MRHTRSATRRLAEKASDRAAHQNTEPDTPCHRAKENIPDNEKQRMKKGEQEEAGDKRYDQSEAPARTLADHV